MDVKGISFVNKAVGGTIYLKFRDPRTGQQRKPSSGSTDRLVAERIASDLSRIIHNNEYWADPPDTLHPKAREIWGSKSVIAKVDVTSPERVAHYLDAVKYKLLEVAKEMEIHWLQRLKSPYKEAVAAALKQGTVSKEATTAFVVIRTAMQKWIDQKMETIEAEVIKVGREAVEEVRLLKSERDALRDRVRELEGLMGKMGKKVLRDQAHTPIKEAIENFLNEKTGGTASKSNGWRQTLRYWIERLGEAIGMNEDIFSIEPRDIIEHCAGYLDDEHKSDTVRRTAINLAKFLEWSTGEATSGSEVRKWARELPSDGEEEWFWLERKQIEKIIKKMKTFHGQYWADVVEIQYACGFRPEEMALLKRDNVLIEAGKVSITIEPLRIDGKVVRRLKTVRSRDTINVPSWAEKTVKRRAKGGGLLLFPRSKAAGENPKWPAYGDVDKKHELWPPADAGSLFSRTYREKLRAVSQATKIGWIEKLVKMGNEVVDQGHSRIDSRTMRRTCAREIILEHGFERAASVIRDNVETLRRHYADLEAKDVSAER